MDNLQKTIVIEIENNQYPITFPTTGQFMEIELKKVQLSRGEYSNLAFSVDLAGAETKGFIDMFSTFMVLCPNLLNDLNFKNYSDIDLFVAKKIYNKVYRKQYLVWYENWMNKLRELDLEDDE